VPAEIRYIVFTTDEVLSAVIAYVLKQGHTYTPNDIAGVAVVGPDEAPAAIVRLHAALAKEPIRLDAHSLVAALLLYCAARRIPLPKNAAKKVGLLTNGLTLTLTIDYPRGRPTVTSNQITYGEITSRATQEVRAAKEELARAIARASHSEDVASRAEKRAQQADAARDEASTLLMAIAMVPGIRGRLGRWLLKFKPSL
jgi:hypothetical protein